MTILQVIAVISPVLLIIGLYAIIKYSNQKRIRMAFNRDTYVEYQVGLIRFLCNIAKDRLEGTGYESLPSGFGIAYDFDGACIKFINKFNSIAGVTKNPINQIMTGPDTKQGYNLVTWFKVDTGTAFVLKELSIDTMRDGISFMYYLINNDNPDIRKFFNNELINIDKTLS